MRMQRAEALSVTDDLTQLYNSRYLSQVLRRETKRASRSGRPLSLLFIDLDGFKGVNDTHGHLAGSAALVEAAAVIRISARETDIVARFGGDEFALVLPDTGSEGAALGRRAHSRQDRRAPVPEEGRPEHQVDRVGRRRDPPGRRRLCRAADSAPPTRRCTGSRSTARTTFTLPGADASAGKNAKIGRNAGPGALSRQLRNNFESAFSVFTVLE